jgi:peptidoglycan/LPS O-acetylase OafA/YrhL
MLNRQVQLAPPPDVPGRLGSDGFRPEIQAIRAVSITLVVAGHLWPTRFPGAVTALDAFFVVSGYLIGAQLIREIERTGSVRITRFYARRVRRLLPAASLVLVCVVVAAFFLVPRTRWTDYAHEVMASALYGENWLLVPDFSGVIDPADFTAVTHYWSLSLEEQFYLCWPWVLLLLFMLRAPWARFTGLAVLGLASLALSVYVTAVAKGPAYLVTPVRVYEFVIGTMLALGGTRFVLPKATAAAASLLGWAAILLPVPFIDHYSPYPGAIALIPAVGAALVIVADASGRHWRLTSSAPMQLLGDLSYSVYRWHYPLIILTPYAVPGGVLTEWMRWGVIVASVVLAYSTKRLVEDPARTWPLLVDSTRLTFVAMVACMATVCLAAGALLWA